MHNLLNIKEGTWDLINEEEKNYTPPYTPFDRTAYKTEQQHIILDISRLHGHATKSRTIFFVLPIRLPFFLSTDGPRNSCYCTLLAI